MQIPANTIYPRTGDRETVYLNAVVSDPNISVGDYTIYNDFLRDPTEFVRNNVLYHYPINGDRLVIGKFCSIACGAKFLFTSANHTLKSLSTYPFPIFYEAWDTSVSEITETWDNRGDIVIGSDVWIGYEAVILSGVRIGDGAIVAARAVVTGVAVGKAEITVKTADGAFSGVCTVTVTNGGSDVPPPEEPSKPGGEESSGSSAATGETGTAAAALPLAGTAALLLTAAKKRKTPLR